MKECNQCGKCCKAYSDGGLSATTREIDDWETWQPEIYAYVSDRKVSDGKIWTDPTTKQQLKTCPWLEELDDHKYGCRIYHNRPEDCRHYPVTIDQMIKDECEMIEVRDLTNTQRAQQTLDKIMSDSRPAYRQT